MHTLTVLLIIWAAIVTQEAPGPYFAYSEADTSLQIAQVVVVDQEGRETILTPEYPFDFKPSNVTCVWEDARWVECLDLGNDSGPARVEYYLKPTQYRQFMPVVARPASVVSETPHTSRRWK